MIARAGRTKRIAALALLAAWVFGPAGADAQTGDLITGGTARETVKGLSIEVDSRWPENPGYLPLRVTITPTRPSAANRSLTIVVTVKTGWGERGETIVEEDVVVPAGASVVRQTIPTPNFAYVNGETVTVFEDGAALKTRRPLRISGRNGYGNQPQSERFPRFLFVGDQPPDTSALGQYFAADAYLQAAGTGSGAPSPGATTPPPLPSGFSMHPDGLPERWIEYTCLDVICLSVDQLDDLSRKRPGAARAIVDWAQSGGTLWVFGAGDDGRRLHKLDSLLGFSQGASGRAGRSDAGPTSAPRWRKPEPSAFGKRPPWISWGPRGASVDVDGRSYTDKAEIKRLWGWSRKRPKTPQEPPFLLSELGFGRVVAIRADDPFPGDPWQWGWIANCMTGRSEWSSRHGCCYTAENAAFWNFLVPGVGLAPVTEFRILISVFVLLIGPVNYFALRRYKRLHLLVLTIPAGAILVTGALFAYALISDGLDVKVRARSVTRIDQRRGQAVCWARLSYYAGLAPYGGLSFSENVAVLPYVDDGDAEWGARRLASWGDGQRLARGWLAARTPTQHFTIRPQATRRGLRIERAADAKGALRIENRLGVPAELLVIRAHDGKYYVATGLTDGRAGEAGPSTEADTVARLRKTLLANEPAFPPDMNQNSPHGGIFGFGRSWRYYARGQQTPVLLETSLMEQSLSALRTAGRMAPGSYVAFVGSQPELELGAPGAVEYGSFHVVLGEW